MLNVGTSFPCPSLAEASRVPSRAVERFFVGSCLFEENAACKMQATKNQHNDGAGSPRNGSDSLTHISSGDASKRDGSGTARVQMGWSTGGMGRSLGDKGRGVSGGAAEIPSRKDVLCPVLLAACPGCVPDFH